MCYIVFVNNTRRGIVMNKFGENVKKLDNILKALGVAFLVFAIVSAGFAVAAFFVDISLLGEIDTYITLGSAKLTLADDALPQGNAAKAHFISGLILADVRFALGCVLVKMIRDIIKPMADGRPFGNNISNGLKKLAIFSLVGGAALEIINFVSVLWTYHAYDVQSLFNSEKVVSFDISHNSYGGFVVAAIVLFVLSYIFKYGEELQTQVDETL